MTVREVFGETLVNTKVKVANAYCTRFVDLDVLKVDEKIACKEVKYLCTKNNALIIGVDSLE